MSAIVRTFRAPDSASALAAVKAALGPDAILVSTRTVSGGLFRRAEVEITAATGSALEPSPARAPAAQPPGHAAAAAFAPRAYARTERETAREAPPARPVDDPLADEVQLLRRSVEEARRALASVTREARAGRELQIPPAAAEVHARLVGRGVEAALAEELVRGALAASARPRAGDLVSRCATGWASGWCPAAPPGCTPASTSSRWWARPASGKTTTIAKIAARALLEAKKRVALLTVDTYRIGACDQLARYGEIMGVPVLVARDRAELVRAYERVQDADLVLVDTAGRSSPEDVARQADLVRAIPRIQLHLVVSAATGALELGAVGERYRALQPDRLLFSKLDEAAGPGGRPLGGLAHRRAR